MADLFTASLLREVGETVEVLYCEASAANEPVLGQEGMWLLCLCVFDFVLAGLAASLCLVASFSSSSSSASSSASVSSSVSSSSSSPPPSLPHCTAATTSTRAPLRPTTATGQKPATMSTSGGRAVGRAGHWGCSYVHPLQIADDFRDRWRTRWTHQQYFVRSALETLFSQLIN